MLTKVQEKRLLNVARALRDAAKARKKFDMEKYVFGDENALESKFDQGRFKYCNTEENFCGTPACALGHYAARTDLQRLLKIVVVKDNWYGVSYAAMGMYGVKNSNWCQQNEVEHHFGISTDEFIELFDYNGCGGAKTPLQAAKYIEKFVKRKQKKTRSTTGI